MNLYNEIKTSVMKNLMGQGVSEKEAEPQAFDVAGAFLPISARTNVFWVGNIRTYITQIRKLMSGDKESREIGSAMTNVFNEICPNSMKDEGEDFYKKQIDFGRVITKGNPSKNSVNLNWQSFNLEAFKKLDKNGFEICDELGVFGSINTSFKFDFRSARDIHRHRAFNVNRVQNYQSVGIESFYLNAISDDKLRLHVSEMFNSSLLNKLSNLDSGEYGMPMATKFSYVMSGDLSAWLYFLKLRSGPKVHPTVISLAQKIGIEFEKTLGLKYIYQRGSADYLKRSGDSNKT
jgi:thymidylate synthase ThyX